MLCGHKLSRASPAAAARGPRTLRLASECTRPPPLRAWPLPTLSSASATRWARIWHSRARTSRRANSLAQDLCTLHSSGGLGAVQQATCVCPHRSLLLTHRAALRTRPRACPGCPRPQLAHKLGSAFHVPHGLANAALISHVIRFNATDRPLKQAVFPQYEFPQAGANLPPHPPLPLPHPLLSCLTAGGSLRHTPRLRLCFCRPLRLQPTGPSRPAGDPAVQAKDRYAELADMLGLGGATPDEKVGPGVPSCRVAGCTHAPACLPAKAAVRRPLCAGDAPD